MSHRSGRGDSRNRGDPRNVGGPPPRRSPRPPDPIPGRVKRRKTKRERDAAKFGPKAALGRWGGAGPPPHRPPWGTRPPASPLPLPKTVVITQKRLCQHRGLFNREVKSLDVERLLSPAQDAAPRSETPVPQLEGDPRAAEQPPPPSSPPEAPQNQKETGPTSRPSLRGLATRLGAVLGRVPAFPGRDLVGERRRTILAALLRRHRVPPDLGFLLAHRNRGADAAPPGCWDPRTLEPDLEQGDFGAHRDSWDTTPPFSGTPAPLRGIVEATPPCAPRLDTPSPVFGDGRKEQESPFSWTSNEEDAACRESPATLFQPRAATPAWGDPLPVTPLVRGPPGCAPRHPSRGRRAPIAPPAFSPLAPRRHRPARRSGTAAPRGPESREALGARSPENPQPPRFVPGRPRAECRAPCCLRHPSRHEPARHDALWSDPAWHEPIWHDPTRDDPARHDALWSDAARHDPIRHDPSRHDALWSDAARHDPMWHDPIQRDPPQEAPAWHNALWSDLARHEPPRHDPIQHDPIQPSALRNDPLRYDAFWNDPPRHDELRNDPAWHDALRNDPWRHDELQDDALWHDELQDDPLRRDTVRDDPLRLPPSPSWRRRPPPLAQGGLRGSRRRRGREERWDLPRPRCRRGLALPSWPWAPRRLPLSCFPEAPRRDGSPGPEGWGCSCAGPR